MHTPKPVSFLVGNRRRIDGNRSIRPITERPGTVIGPYKLLQQIGEGGMGVVFMAEQTEPIQRTVALKIIKPGMDTRQVIARFEAERQALAMMDHPNIAKVLDAGTTDTGRPYFVMELVKGVPITKYCDEKHLPLRAAAGAVHAGLPGRPACPSEGHHPSRHQAHERAGGRVRQPRRPQSDRLRRRQGHGPEAHRTDDVHRVRPGDRHGRVHEPRAGRSSTSSTSTPAATSIRSACCSTSCLTGSTPFERKRLREAAFDEVLRIIREEEPPKPSTQAQLERHAAVDRRQSAHRAGPT